MRRTLVGLPPTSPVKANRLLAHMTPDGHRLRELLRPTVLTQGDVLFEAQTTGRQIYFPLDCVVSLLAPMQGHAPLEVAMVGREGMLGLPLLLGSRTSRVRALVQGSGSALCISAGHLRQELRWQPRLRRNIDRYIHSFIAQLTQTAACYAFHPVEARCARSLLMARDRLESDELELTHELLAQMLGVRRVGVTVAAGNLQRLGMIAYARGRIVILDPKRLCEAACECYGVIRRVYDREEGPASSDEWLLEAAETAE